MQPFHTSLLLTTLLIVVSSTVATPPEHANNNEPLPSCDTDVEIQFYNAHVDVLKLPSACNSRDLIDIGFMIQDVFDQAGYRMRDFEQEKMQTTSCPSPLEIINDEVDGKLYRYLATGRAERCKGTSAKDRSLQERSVCSATNEIMSLKRKVDLTSTTANGVLKRMEEAINNRIFDKVDLGEMLQKVSNSTRSCQEASAVAASVASTATSRCNASSGALRSSTELSIRLVTTEHETMLDILAKAKQALSHVRMIEREILLLHFTHDDESRRNLASYESDLRKVCSVAEDTEDEARETEAAVSESIRIYQAMKFKVDELATAEAEEIFSYAQTELSLCQSHSETAAKASSKAAELCAEASKGKLKDDTTLKAQEEHAIARDAKRKAERNVSQIKDYQRDLEHLPTPTQSPTTFVVESSPAASSFGIQDLILVDARANRDIAVIGSPGCNPLNKCFGSATRFNVRAQTFGDIDTVDLTSNGPIKESGRTEGIFPYTVWGDDGHGDYNEIELKPGTYTVTARATNDKGIKSSIFTKTFTVEPSASVTPSSSGILDLILVDSEKKRDIATIGSPECEPLNKCFGSATRFNIRAAPFGNIKNVYLTCDGPVSQPGRTESIYPYSFWGDYGTGDYEEVELTPGAYTVTARATNDKGIKSPTFTRTFTVVSPSVAASLASSAPTSVPTASPTVSPTESPTMLPTASPTSMPTASPTNSPTDLPTKSPTMLPTISPTAMPTYSPTDSPMELPTASPTTASLVALEPSAAPSSNLVKLLAKPFEDGYAGRLSSNLDSSNTGCEIVANAMLQKTLAEEAVLTSYVVYDETKDLAIGFEGNTDVDRIKLDLETAQTKVLQESSRAAAAANMVSESCSTGESGQMYQELATAIIASIDSREALSVMKAARDEMEDAVALLEFDPTMSELEAADEEDEIVIAHHLDDVDSEISNVDSVLQDPEQLPIDDPKLVALGHKRESLVDEETQLQDVLSNQEQFSVSQSALKRDELYERFAPDFIESPPLEYIIRAIQIDDDLTVETNWEPKGDDSDGRGGRFRKFSGMLATNIPARLMLSRGSLTDGCLVEGAEVDIAVYITELESVWEQFVPKECPTAFLARGPGRGFDSPGRGFDGAGSTGPVAASPVPMQSESNVCENDVCTDICQAACVDDEGLERLGTYVKEYSGMTVQCCVSGEDPWKKQCYEETSGMLGKNRYDGESFGDSDVDALCCVGKYTCKRSHITMPSNGVCCRSPLFTESDINFNDQFEACEKANFIAPYSASKNFVTCQGKRACKKSYWSSAGDVDLCCSGDDVCEDLLPEGTGVTPIFLPQQVEQQAVSLTSPLMTEEHDTESSATPFTSTSSQRPPKMLDGIVLYNDDMSGSIRSRALSDGSLSFGTVQEIANTGSSEWRFMHGASSLTRDEKILVARNTVSNLHAWTCTDAQCHDSSQWSEISISPLETNLVVDVRTDAQVGYESRSGDALLVWGNDGFGLRYSKWNGESWSDVNGVTAYNGTEAMWIRLASNPLSNEITAVVTDSRGERYILVWNGSEWSNPVSESIGRSRHSPEKVTSTSVAYETLTGIAMVVYDDGDSTDERKLCFRLSSDWTRKRCDKPSSSVAATAYRTTLASNPDAGSKQIVLGVQTSENEFWVSVWRGASWQKPIEGTSVIASETLDPLVAVAFESDSGVDGKAIAVYGSPPRSRIWSDNDWSTESFVFPPNNVTSLTLEPNPSSNVIMLTAVASDGLYCSLWDGFDWSLNETVTSEAFDTTKDNPTLFLWGQSPL